MNHVGSPRYVVTYNPAWPARLRARHARLNPELNECLASVIGYHFFCAAAVTLPGRIGRPLFLRDPNTRRRLLHPCTLQTAQEGDEGLDVVRGEYTTDRKSPQPRGIDLNGFRGVAIDFRRHLLERSVLEGDLTSQPGRGALRIDLQRD